jgi:hypothetical protein
VQAILQATPPDHTAVTATATALTDRRHFEERLNALAALHCLGALTATRLEAAFADPSPEVRVKAIELGNPELDAQVYERLIRDPDQRVRDAVRRTKLGIAKSGI